MAFALDSLPVESLAALILLVVAIWSWRMTRGWRAGSRVHLRFAAVLLAALAAALPVPSAGLAWNVMLLATGAAGWAMALAVFFRDGTPAWLSATALALAFAAGLTASLAALPLVGAVSLIGAALLIFLACPARMKNDPRCGLAALAGAAALLLGSLTMMEGAVVRAALFFAAALGLLARALQQPVEQAQARIERLVGAKSA